MTAANTPLAATGLERGPSSALIALVAISTGALVANLYYAQPLIAAIAPEIGIGPDLAGSVVSVTQIGYGAGLFLLVSLADLVETRQLVLTMLGITTFGLVGAALSTAAVPFFLFSFLIGLCSTGAQILIPLIAHLAPVERRGRILGNVMAGVLTGIMLARPVALFIAASFGWRAVFWSSAALMLAIGAALARLMPEHRPRAGMHYGQILASMSGLLRDMPVLRRRAAYQALMFAAFNLFWTAAPFMLAERFGLNEHGIGLFALAGAGGALSAPITGRLADRGLTGALTAGAMLVLCICFYATGWAATALALGVLLVLTVLIDAAVQVNQVASQRLLFSGPPETRGRVNALYMTFTFIGGALGSVLGTLLYHWGGWDAAATAGGLIGATALALFAIHARGAGRSGAG